MKKNAFIFLLLSLVALAETAMLFSCKPEGLGGNEFEATLENYSSTQGAISEMKWAKNDQIIIFGEGGSGTYTANPHNPPSSATFVRVGGSDVSAPCRAFYPSTLSSDGTNVALPTTQRNEDGGLHYLPMFAESNDENLQFRNLCGALRVHLTKANTSISSIKVSAGTTISGTFRVNSSGGNPSLNHTMGGSNVVTLECTSPQDIGGGHSFYIALPAGTYSGLQIEINTSDSRYCMINVGTDVVIQRSKYSTLTFSNDELAFMEPLHEGTLTGLFSVSADIQVHFSQGNLQYQPSTGTWRFAEQQYSYIGSANSKISASYGGWIDLFGWGTGSNPTNYSSRYTDYFDTVDWSTMAISNGGNRAGTWRTLTATEWAYLFTGRSYAAEKWGSATVAGIHGLIILPDTYTMPQGISFHAAQTGWLGNNFTMAQWNQMQAAGAVFLTTSGMRMSRKVGYVGTNGFYWSSSVVGEQYARSICFGSSGLQSSYSQDRSCGLAVRPVRNKE